MKQYVKYKSTYKFISFLLIFLLFFNVVSISVVEAVNYQEFTKANKQKHVVKTEEGDIPNILPKERLEIKSKRTEFSTRFLNPDGSFTEEIYLEPIFYKDPIDKEWKEIDNTLKASTKRAG